MRNYLVGIDEGTMGCKTCIFDLEGELIAYDYREYGSIYPKPGWVEQSADELTEALYSSCKAAIEKSGIDPKEILGVGLSTQGGVVGAVDENGKIIGNFIGWQDTRCFETNSDTSDTIPMDEYYKIEGWSVRGLMHPYRTHLWLEENQPELHKKAARFVTNQEYFLRKFGAIGYYTDSSSACREGLADTDKHEYSEKLIKAAGMDPAKRGTVVDHGTVVGFVTKEVAEKTGLAEGTSVCVGALDQDCSTFGAGMIREGDACVVMGTFGACFVVTEKPVRDAKERLIVKSHTRFKRGPNTYTLEGMSTTSASAFRWYRDQVARLEKKTAQETNGDPYNLICKEAEKSEPGSRGLTFLPYFTGATARGNADAKGAFVGIRLDTVNADMSRAVLEGITFEMFDIIKIVEASGVEINSVRLAGGPTKSPFWCQIQADIYQKPVIVVKSPETGCLGAALFAGIGVGAYVNAYDAVDKAVKIAVTYQPHPENFAAYTDAYERYLSIYKGLSSTKFGKDR